MKMTIARGWTPLTSRSRKAAPFKTAKFQRLLCTPISTLMRNRLKCSHKNSHTSRYRHSYADFAIIPAKGCGGCGGLWGMWGKGRGWGVAVVAGCGW